MRDALQLLFYPSKKNMTSWENNTGATTSNITEQLCKPHLFTTRTTKQSQNNHFFWYWMVLDVVTNSAIELNSNTTTGKNLNAGKRKKQGKRAHK